MNGTEIIEAARLQFGETTALTLQDTDLQKILNLALQEVYTLLVNLDEIRPTVTTDSLALSSGKGTIPVDWHEVLTVADSTGPYTRADQATINNIDRLGSYFEPETPVWTLVGDELWVRPTIASVTVQHSEGPAKITSFGSEITDIPARWHPTLVHFVTSLAYAQEEDLEQAGHYRSLGMSLVQARVGGGEEQ